MRKPQFQPSLASLTEADREQLADWLRRDYYDVVRDRVNKPRPEGFGLNITEKPLRTFYARVALFDLINARLPDDKKLTLAEFESLAQGDILMASSENEKSQMLNEQCSMNERTPAAQDSSMSGSLNESLIKNQQSTITADVHAAILRTTYDLATSGDNTPHQLLALQRLADLPARAEIRQQRLELDHKKFEHKVEMDAFRKDLAAERLEIQKKRLALTEKLTDARLTAGHLPPPANPSPSRRCDHLGPLIRRPEDIEARADRKFGLTPTPAINSAPSPGWPVPCSAESLSACSNPLQRPTLTT
jgi:hypothetical protein